MNVYEVLALALDPGFILRRRGIQPDPWQQKLLLSEDRQILLNCSRQSGKSTTVAVLALHTALCRSRSLILLLSPSLRQSVELFRKVLDCFSVIRHLMSVHSLNQTGVEFRNRSRIICLPGREETIRSFSGVSLLVIDEAARVPDDLYRSVRPMLAVSRGRLICLSTPFGKRGFFHSEWHNEQAPWLRIRIPWRDCPRIGADFIELERTSMGDSWLRQEYECSFEALEGLVYPDFEEQCAFEIEDGGSRMEDGGRGGSGEPSRTGPARLAGPTSWPPAGRRVGGIDFGFRNPFCALWGVLDRDDVLWISDERYVREAPLHEHVAALKAAEDSGSRLPDGTLRRGPARQAGPTRSSIIWYADPAGRTEIEELRHAGLKVVRGSNSITAGIAAVNARLRTGRLRVLKGVGPASRAGRVRLGSPDLLRPTGCPNLLAEAKLYRYPPVANAGTPAYPGSPAGVSGSEIPIDQHNHALAALRYLVSRLDAGFMARFRRVGQTLLSAQADKSVCPTGEQLPKGGDTSRVALSQVQLESDELWQGLEIGD